MRFTPSWKPSPQKKINNMNMETREKLDAYYTQAGSWADERTQSIHASRKVAWIVALVASVIAFLLALTIVFMLPLKTIVPQTLLVDKQTGFVQAIDPRRPQKISADEALTRSFLAQYVVAREGFDIATVKASLRRSLSGRQVLPAIAISA